MFQKGACTLSTKFNRLFYDKVKIRAIIILNANIFTTWKIVQKCHHNFTDNLTEIKLKCLEKIGGVWFICKKWQVR